MKKILIIFIVLCGFIMFSSVCMAEEEKPLGNITREEAIQKLFIGRTLDPIEGIWFSSITLASSTEIGTIEILIVKTPLLNLRNPADYKYDYTAILVSLEEPKKDLSKQQFIKGQVWDKLSKTEYPNILKGGHFPRDNRYLRSFLIISPTAFACEGWRPSTYVRTYPPVQ